MTTTTKIELARKVGEVLELQQLQLVTAESCTGGMVAEVITSVSGSAGWFGRGFVTYSNQAKQDLLGVNPSAIVEFGAVSAEVVKQMAEGALRNSQADVAIGITGIAGLTGGTPDKPVGTVFFAWAKKDGETITKLHYFKGERNEIREQATEFVLNELLNMFSENGSG